MKIEKLKFKLITLTLFLTIMVGCIPRDVQNESNLKNSILDGDVSHKWAELGFGYSEKNRTLLRHRCVNGNVVQRNSATTGSHVNFQLDASFDDINKALSGSLNSAVNLSLLNASAGAELAKNTSRSRLTTNVFASFRAISQSRYLDPASRVSALPGSTPNFNIEEYCGTDFVSQIDYGASFAVSLEITARSEKQRQWIHGQLKANFAGIVKGEGNLDNVNESEQSDFNVHIHIHQLGGIAENVLMAIPKEGLSCSAADFNACVKNLHQIIRYMQTQFRSDLLTQKNWVPLRIHTISYNQAYGLSNLSSTELLTELSQRLIHISESRIAEIFKATTADWKDLITLESDPAMGEAVRRELSLTRKIIESNLEKLAVAIHNCEKNFEYCSSIAINQSYLALDPYDQNFFDLAFNKKAEWYCSNLLKNLESRGRISEAESGNLKLEGSAPLLADVHNEDSQIVGFIPCIRLYEKILER